MDSPTYHHAARGVLVEPGRLIAVADAGEAESDAASIGADGRFDRCQSYGLVEAFEAR
jgi:hypothetical protein